MRNFLRKWGRRASPYKYSKVALELENAANPLGVEAAFIPTHALEVSEAVVRSDTQTIFDAEWALHRLNSRSVI